MLNNNIDNQEKITILKVIIIITSIVTSYSNIVL